MSASSCGNREAQTCVRFGDIDVKKCIVLFLMMVIDSIPVFAKDGKIAAWQPFEYISHNIFVRCTVSGTSGATMEADFIVDTGLNRTTISTLLANKLGLSGDQVTRAHSSTGVTYQRVVDLPSLAVGNETKPHLKVALEDLSLYAAQYRHKVDGFLGTDFFGDTILSLDVSKHRLSLDSNTKLDGEPQMEINATPFSGLLLVPVTLPNDLTLFVIVDTGADHPTDFMFYGDALSGVALRAAILSESGNAASAPQPVIHGTIDSIRVGDLTIAGPSVTRLPTPADNPYRTVHRPGLLNCQFFERYSVQIDFPHHLLKLLPHEAQNERARP
jgi:hypothetical protein